jgi:hypothetical protein
LRPALRWARWALIFLLAFTFLRGAVWAMTFPSWYGPDEDYHFLYIERLTVEHSFPSKDKPFYPLEYPKATDSMKYHDYYGGPRPDFGTDDPKRSVRAVENLPESDRRGEQEGRGVGVVHPPLYHALGAVVNWALGDRSTFTRYAAIKWLTSLFGVLAVYAAWLLAAQLFRQEPLRLLVAFLVATQPMVALLSGIVNHDELLIATMTLAAAMLLFLLRTEPRARQGLWVGIPIALALLVKATALILIPIAAIAYAVQWLVNRDRGREVLRSMALAGGVVLVGAGWWYLGGLIFNSTLTGEVAGPVADSDAAPFTLGHTWSLAREWTGYTYRTYWFHHYWYEAPRSSPIYYLPGFIGALGALGLGLLAWSLRRTFLSRENPLLRQAAFLVLLALALYVPLLVVDLRHWYDGQGFSMTGGRYLLPAYAGVAALLVVGLRELFAERTQPVVFSALAALSALFCWKVWTVNYVHRYYGDSKASWQTIFRNMSFDRPEFVTATTLRVAVGLVFASLLGAVVCVAAGSRPPREGAVARGRAGLRRRRARAKTA